ncbi:MAG: hypothetical protein AAGA18_15150 [Verrucomicrobiota bacterium]
MGKPQAIAITTTQVLVAGWFAHWQTFTLSRSPFLAFIVAVVGLVLGSIPAKGVIAHEKALIKLERHFHHFREILPFEQYRAFLPLYELATLWTLALIGGNILIYFYLYQLFPLVTPLTLYGWDKVVITVYTLIGGSVLAFIYTLVLNWLLTDKSVQEFEEKGDLQVFSTIDNELKHEDQTLTPPKRAFERLPSALLLALSVPVGFYLHHGYGASLALIAVHALVGLKTWFNRSLFYGAASAVVLIAALVLVHPASLLPQVLYLLSVVLVSSIAASAHENARRILPLYWRVVRAILWGMASLVWGSFGYVFPVLVCVLFSFGNLISFSTLIARRLHHEPVT